MNANRAAKGEQIARVPSELDGAGLVVVLQPAGLNASESLDLRRKMRAAGVSVKVRKNTLVRRAIQGTAFEGLTPFLKGPTALAYSKDPVAAAKVAADFAKKNEKLKIVGATMGGQVLDRQATLALAMLPSLDELRGKLVGLLVAPATKIAGVLQAPAGQLARVMAARAKQAA